MGATRWARAAVVAALVLGTATASSAAAPPPPTDTSAFCAAVPDGHGGFGDTSGNEDNIECLAYAGITSGVPGGGYDPSGIVTRAQMATFVARLLDTVAELDNGSTELRRLPASGPDAFTDDDGLEPHEANIDRLAVAGIVAGSGDGTFQPGQPVNRAQMATFINNAHAFLTGSPLTSTEDFFVDDDGLEPHEANIDAIAAAGIAQGVSPDRYAPTTPVTRSQMASFLVRDLATLHAGGAIDALSAAEPGATGFIDGTITTAGESCTWTDGTTSARPPDTLVVDPASILPPDGNGTCTAGAQFQMDEAPTVTFDDATGTATITPLGAVGTAFGLTCEYRADDAVVQREGTSRAYTGTVQADLVAGDPECPASFDIDAQLTFR